MLTVVVAAGSNELRKSADAWQAALVQHLHHRAPQHNAQCNANLTTYKLLQSNLAASACCWWDRFVLNKRPDEQQKVLSLRCS
jgi:hypothetical protein